ncbi:hypothetical protein [Niallia taxi]|uniref:hypothetical protein n=1 Tax=Niallia taxi TaxID=2499688 RepID=UPI002E20E673|nr:hypothetical protein [Niallia taxi]
MKGKKEVVTGSNLGISMVESYSMFFRHYDFETLLKFENKFNLIPKMHIYMVVKVPKVIFVSDSIKIHKGNIEFALQVMDGRDENKVQFKLPYNLEYKGLNLSLSPNKDDLEIKDSLGRIIQKANAFIFLISSGYVIDCEVVYIGRSFGKTGEKTVYSRLKSHSTLQKVYAEKEDDKSIFLSSWDFDRNTISFISPLEVDYQKNYDIFMKQLEMKENPYELISKKQEINFTEAALIRYFQPKYNDIMKYRFPSKTHKEYSDLFKEDVDYVSVEIDTRRLNVRLYSEGIPADFEHNPFYGLKDKRSKYDFFRII